MSIPQMLRGVRFLVDSGREVLPGEGRDSRRARVPELRGVPSLFGLAGEALPGAGGEEVLSLRPEGAAGPSRGLHGSEPRRRLHRRAGAHLPPLPQEGRTHQGRSSSRPRRSKPDHPAREGEEALQAPSLLSHLQRQPEPQGRSLSTLPTGRRSPPLTFLLDPTLTSPIAWKGGGRATTKGEERSDSP